MSGSVIERRVGDQQQQQGGGDVDMSIEARARRMGWYPQAEYRGRPEDWMDAEAFVKRAEEEMPILRSQLRNLDAKLAGSEAQSRALQGQVQTMNQRLNEAVEAIDSMRELSSKAEQRGFERAMKRLKEEAKEAAASGDAAKVEAVMEQTKELLENRVKPTEKPEKKPTDAGKPQQQQQQQQGGDPVIAAWANDPDREWYRTSLKMNLYAQAVFEDLVETRRDLTTAERLAETEREVMKKFPTSHHFATRQRPPRSSGGEPPPINPPSGGDHGTGGKTGWDALPPEAKAEYNRIAKGFEMRKGKPGYKPYTKEEFLRQYNGD